MEDILQIPDFYNEVFCITDNPIFGAVISSYFNEDNRYFSLLEAPRLARPDASNEMMRRTNLMARIQPQVIILADVSDEIVLAFTKYVPIRKMLRIKTLGEIDSILKETFGFEDLEKLPCKPSEVAIGLLTAKSQKKHLLIADKAPTIALLTKKQSASKRHLVVIDDNRWISPIIAANYAFSINADLQFFPEKNEEEIEIVYDDISNARCHQKSARGSEASRSLMSQQLTYESYFHTNKIDAAFVTFITRGIPYGYFFPDVPSSHLFSYPDLGITLLNNLYYAHEVKGTRSALLIDPDVFPKKWGETETGFVSEKLKKMGVYVKELRGREAKVYDTSLHIQWFPFDLLFICSHASRMDGQEFTIKFSDRSGADHEIVIEEAVSFGLTDEGEGDQRLVEVMSFIGFVSVDGFAWKGKNEKSKGSVTKETIEDFLAIPREKWQVVNKRDIPYVRRSTRIGLADGDYQATFHALSGGELPIIFNNACVSFYEFSGRFFFAGARSYIGTLTPINTDKAKEIAQLFFNSLTLSKPLPLLLWEVQKKVFPDPANRVYVHIGTHFCNILPPQSDTNTFVSGHINTQIERMKKKLSKDNPPDVTRNIQRAVKFLSSVKS